MRTYSVIAVVNVAFLSCASLLVAGSDSRFSFEPPQGSKAMALVIVELQRGYPTGETYCPGEPKSNADNVCISASVALHRGSITRLLATTQGFSVEPPAGNFRKLAPHAVRWVEGGPFVAFVEQTDKDYRYIQWATPLTKGKAASRNTPSITTSSL